MQLWTQTDSQIDINAMTNPTKSDKLFIGTFGNDQVASINWTKGSNNDSSFYFLKQGFKSGFEKLLKDIINNPPENVIDYDFYIYPILFCLRHYVELTLKDTIRNFHIATYKVQPDEFGFDSTHDISKLFETVQTHLNDNPPQFTGEIMTPDFSNQLESTKCLIKELSGFDNGSFAFRYPFKRENKLTNKVNYIIPELSINLVNLRDTADKLIYILDCIGLEANAFCFEEQLKNTLRPL